MDMEMRIHAAGRLIEREPCRAVHSELVKLGYRGRFLEKQSHEYLTTHFRGCQPCLYQYKTYRDNFDNELRSFIGLRWLDDLNADQMEERYVDPDFCVTYGSLDDVEFIYRYWARIRDDKERKQQGQK